MWQLLARRRPRGFHGACSSTITIAAAAAIATNTGSSCRRRQGCHGYGDGGARVVPVVPFSTCNCPRSVTVTRSNFRSVLERSLRGCIHGADFLSVHAVLTGRGSSAPWRRTGGNPMETLHTSYLNLRDSAHHFAMLQLGLCAFSWQSSPLQQQQQQLVAKPFNFYLFPQDGLKLRVDSASFLCDTADLEAMANCGFDFNTCIQQGITYMSREEELMAGRKVGFESEDYTGVQMLGTIRKRCSNDVEMSSSDKIFSQHIRKKIVEWLRENGTGGRVISNGDIYQQVQPESDQKLSMMFRRFPNSNVVWYKSCEPPRLLRASMKWESLGHHEVLVLLEVLQLDYKDLVAVVQPDSPSSRNKNVHIFYVASDAERVVLLEELEQGESKEKERQLLESIGLRHVIDCIVESKKVVIGHHCILDFLHIVKNFFKPLPFNAVEFSSMLTENFPCIIDTEYLARNIIHLDNDNESTLEDLYSTLCCGHGKKSYKLAAQTSDVLASNKTQSGRQQLQPKVCDNGNKAYMAGCLFAHICDVTNTDPSEIRQLVDMKSKKGIRKHMNKLYLNSLVPLVLDLSTGREVNATVSVDQQIDNPSARVALLWGYTSGTAPSSIQSAINELLKAKNLVDIYPLDDSSALARFSSAEAIEQFLSMIERCGKLHGVDGLRVARFAAYEVLCKYGPSMQRLADCARSMNLGSPQL